jgi:uncharacterized BrkB/YihY/UPF0761 family membrane protein
MIFGQTQAASGQMAPSYLTALVTNSAGTKYTESGTGEAGATYSELSWFRVVDDGTTRLWQSSRDGNLWTTRWTDTHTTFVTANQIGFVNCGSNVGNTSIFKSFKIDYSG